MIQLEDTVVARLDIKRAMIKLKPRYQEVVRLRFGLDDCGVHTLREVGQIIGVNPERARQIEAQAIRIMRGALVRKYAVSLRRERLADEKIVVIPDADELERRQKERAAKKAASALKRALDKEREAEQYRLRQEEQRRQAQARQETLERKRAHYAPSTMQDLWKWWGGVVENVQEIMRDHRMTEDEALVWVLR